MQVSKMKVMLGVDTHSAAVVFPPSVCDGDQPIKTSLVPGLDVLHCCVFTLINSPPIL